MRLLLDTHALLWWLLADPRLGQAARDMIADPANDVLVSVASLWEIQVKVRVGKLKADLDRILDAVRDQGFDIIGIAPAHLLALGDLPRHHGDPWDHLLIAQANAEGAVFVSEDRHVPAYPVAFVRCSGSAQVRPAGQSETNPPALDKT
ncbi:twitching motility protein PilT [Methylobacterium sp. Leaf94]|uniref:type II toxin-antitoxin system VapC family toxin n=1 Tax=Methylobacterium sp. Leaf94 TaxID=1736250 RepID=UPI0007020090|nr:type II toxin-antitoxin system VapC family toxin [Methylobacterium sp. Leaf94]KQU34080.1 twitching motility protein PilT [Methylobacterium sp. Leaf94]